MTVSDEREYDSDPGNEHEFTRSFDRAYTRFAGLYDLAVRHLLVWSSWVRAALPHIGGPRVLEVSFGTGYLLTQYAGFYETHGIDYNTAMVRTARSNLERTRLAAHLCRARVEALPYVDRTFDTVVNTMAFSGYPNAASAMGELKRVLRSGGRLVLIDVNYPADGNRFGRWAVGLARRSGDRIRDINRLLAQFGFAYRDVAVGGWGSIHLYVADKVA